MALDQQQINTLLERLISGIPETKKPAIRPVALRVTGIGVWRIDPASSDPVTRGSAKNVVCVVRMTGDHLDGINEEPSRFWPLVRDGGVRATNFCYAAALLDGFFPGAVMKTVPSSVYSAIFNPDRSGASGSCEYNQTDGVATTYGCTEGGFYPITYGVLGDLAVFEGDIVLGTVANARAVKRNVESAKSESEALNNIHVEGFRTIVLGTTWPDNCIPYQLNENLDAAAKVAANQAAEHITDKTNLTIREKVNADENWVEVVPGDGCSSFVGMQGGEQELTLSGSCGRGSAIHEFGHASGLFHEHVRYDRNSFIEINFDNIEEGKEGNFEIPEEGVGEELELYDYGSIMHYSRDAFSRYECKEDPPITAVDDPPEHAGKPIEMGQRAGLSDEDVEAINTIYPSV